MATTQETLSGLAPNIQLGIGGGRFKWDGSVFQFRDSIDTAFTTAECLSLIAPRVGTIDATSFFLRANNTDFQEINSDGDMGFGTTAGATHNYAFQKDVNANSIFLIENSNVGALSEADLWIRSGSNDLRIGVTSTAFVGWAGAAFIEHKGGKEIRFYSPSLLFTIDPARNNVWTNTDKGVGVGIANFPTGALASANGRLVNVTAVSSSTYTILTTDDVVAVTAPPGGCVLTLPAAPQSGQRFQICDEGGNASTRPITLAGNGVNLDGDTEQILTQDYGALTVIYTGTIWKIF